MSRSNLTEAISAIDRCSDDELRQIQALISVRLGEGAPRKSQGSSGKKIDGGKRGGKPSKAPGSGKSLKKGNPQRKSQFATHPVYQAYKAAKQAVEKVSKEGKIPFKDVTGEARDQYDEALSNWLQTKSGFRRSKKEDENSGSQPAEDQKVKAGAGGNSSVLGSPSATTASSGEPPKKKRQRTSGEGLPKGKYSLPPDSWNPKSGEEWNTLSRDERRRIWQMETSVYDSGMQD